MGPVMPPSKKPGSSGVSVASGLSQFYQASSITRALQEAEEMDLALPTIKLEKGSMEDEELTNLNWLHESKNLLNSFGDPVLRSVSPVQDLDDDTPPSPAHSDVPYDAKQNPNCKPPYSFSCLIFMAIEDAPSKRLPVKDIYNWILDHFPYFANAPTGWKNSVRHNLSLNKCFKKVDKDRSQYVQSSNLARKSLLQKKQGSPATRSVLGYRLTSDGEPTRNSPLVSSDPKEDHTYSFAKSSSSDVGEEAHCDGSEVDEADAEEDDKSKIKKEPKEWSVDALALAQHKKRQHLTKVKQRVASDTLPLKKRRTEKPPESDDEEMKEAAGSLLHLAGVRACLNNITNRTAKGQKEQK
uniref:Forkhead box N3 n=1 Tax=Cyprinus carpio TaxID=7962 RepID=A0A8C2IDL2_CYPCA